MENELIKIRDNFIFALDKATSFEEREKILNIIKFIDTYEISVDILRRYDETYYTADKLKNIAYFIHNYDTDIKHLYANNESIVQYEKRRR